jgi:hypothetical protein
VLTTLPPSVSRLSIQCGILNFSQPYRPPHIVTGIAFIGWHCCNAFVCSQTLPSLTLQSTVVTTVYLPSALIFRTLHFAYILFMGVSLILRLNKYLFKLRLLSFGLCNSA